MIRGRIFWPALTLIALLAACVAQETADIDDEVAEAAAMVVLDAEAAAAVVDAMEQGFIDAYDAEDGAALAALFAADGTQARPLMPSLDVAAIEAANEATFASGADYSLEIEREDMIVADGWIVTWGGFVSTVVAEGAEPVTVTGRYGVIDRQEPDGTWKIYRHIFNYEVPPPGYGLQEK